MSIRQKDSFPSHIINEDGTLYAVVQGHSDAVTDHRAREIVISVNAHQKLIDSLQFLADAAQGAVKATPGLSVEETKLIGAIELARVTLALAKDDEEAALAKATGKGGEG